MSEPDVPKMMKSYIWLKTADGSIQQVEQEVAIFSPFISHEIKIHAGVGSSKTYPISLPKVKNPVTLNLILDYCRFHQGAGRSDKELKSCDEKLIPMDIDRLFELADAADNLQLKSLVALTMPAIKRLIEGKFKMMKSYIWLKTADGSIQQVEQEVAIFSPFIRHEIKIHAGVGSSETYPISLPKVKNPVTLNLILDYCRFHQGAGRSDKELKSFDEKLIPMDIDRLFELADAADNLQLKSLVALTMPAIKRLIEGKFKSVEVEAEHVDDRPVDDRSVDDLLSFINGENGDSKEVKAPKNKKNRNKKKDQQKNAPPVCTVSDTSSSPNNAIKESNGVSSVGHDDKVKGCCLPDVSDLLKLQDSEVELDDCDDFEDLMLKLKGSRLHDDIINRLKFQDSLMNLKGPCLSDSEDECVDCDPEIIEKIDREVEDFARTLNSDWPERSGSSTGLQKHEK